MSDLQDLQKLQLLEKYKPILVFHPDEDFFPISLEHYIQKCELYSITSKIVLHKTPTLQSLTDLSTITDKSENYSLRIKSFIDDEINMTELLSTVKHMDDGRILLIYTPFYKYNGNSYVFGFIPVGYHQADLEAIICELDINQQLIGYHLSTHGDFTFHTPNELHLSISGHYKIYVAKHSHAHYSRAKLYPRFGGTVFDTTGNGLNWNPPLKLASHQFFNTYKGYLGDKHVGTFAIQSFWRDGL